MAQRKGHLMYIYIRDHWRILNSDVQVLKPEQSENELVKGHVNEIKSHRNEKDNFIVELQIDGDSCLVQVLFLLERVDVVDHEPPFRVASDTNGIPLLILYDSPPKSLVMSASVAAVYMVLKPVYTAICSVVV